jgi:hypothetical protein
MHETVGCEPVAIGPGNHHVSSVVSYLFPPGTPESGFESCSNLGLVWIVAHRYLAKILVWGSIRSRIFLVIPEFWLPVQFSRPHMGETGAPKSVANILAAYDLVRQGTNQTSPWSCRQRKWPYPLRASNLDMALGKKMCTLIKALVDAYTYGTSSNP